MSKQAARSDRAEETKQCVYAVVLSAAAEQAASMTFQTFQEMAGP